MLLLLSLLVVVDGEGDMCDSMSEYLGKVIQVATG